jgi:hypothetical protein
MKKARPWITLTLAFYLAFLFWTLPAHYVLSSLEKLNVLPAAGFSVSGVGGAWTGGRILAVKTGGVEFNNLVWRFQPSGLIFGRVQFAMTCDFADGSVAGVLRLGPGDIELEKIQGGIPAASLGQIYLPGFELSGVLEIEDLALSARDGYLSGGFGQIAWRNAKVSSPYQMSLGGVKLDLSTENGGIVFKVNDLGGSLQTNGLAFYHHRENIPLMGQLAPGKVAHLNSPLFCRFLADREPMGWSNWNLRGKWPNFFDDKEHSDNGRKQQ